MDETERDGVLAFLRAAERLKDALRSAHTSGRRRESVAEHTWRLCLMAVFLRGAFPVCDFARLIRLSVIHDLGETLGGVIPAVDQAAAGPKAGQERRDLLHLLEPLPELLRSEVVALWDEYEAAATPEARLAKGLDRLDTILQHTQGRNPTASLANIVPGTDPRRMALSPFLLDPIARAASRSPRTNPRAAARRRACAVSQAA